MKAGMKLVCGVGITDAGYVISNCDFHQRWRTMLSRCYSPSNLRRNPSYDGVSVCDEWLSFDKFKAWMETQDWQGKQLDKDILCGTSEKIYSPETCAFITERTNFFVQRSLTGKSTGATYDGLNKKWRAQINNHLTGKKVNLGRFNSKIEAEIAWAEQKHKLSIMVAETESDPRVVKALPEIFKRIHLSLIEQMKNS